MKIARYLPRFQRCEERIAELARREEWSSDQMRQWQLEQLNSLWSHASKTIRYYRELAATKRLPDRFESLDHFIATMPVLKKEEVRNRPDDFRSPDATRGKWHYSSGSTGQPMRFFRSNATHQTMLCHQYRFRQMWGLDLFDRAAFLGAGTPHSAPMMQRLRQSVVDRLRNRVRLPVHQLSPAALRQQLQRINRFHPAYLYGYSGAIDLFAREAIEADFKIAGLKIVMLTSEPAFAHMIETIEKAFAAPTVIEYGSVECGVMAYEWPDRTLRVRSDRVLLETLARGDNRCDLIVTILDNPDFPLFRYRIEDVTDVPLAATDHPFPILKNIAGRNDDVLFAGDGSAIHPAEIDGVFESNRRLNVRRYRLHQHSDGSIVVQVEPMNKSTVDRLTIARSIEKVVPGRSVKVETVESIAQTASGKHRLITSELSAR